VAPSIAANKQVFPVVGNIIFVWPELLLVFYKVKYYELKLGFVHEALNHGTTELPLLIAPMSIPTIGNINVVCSRTYEWLLTKTKFLNKCLVCELIQSIRLHSKVNKLTMQIRLS